MRLSRRNFLQFLAVIPGLAAYPPIVSAATSPQWAELLDKALNDAALPEVDTIFSVKSLLSSEHHGKATIVAIVEVTWTPGFRRRKFTAFGSNEEDAFLKLLASAKDEFQRTGALV